MQVRDRISENSDSFTSAEHKLGSSLLADYPFAGLEPIQVLSEKTQVSAASISRFVNKIGFRGFQEFQRQLIEELKERERSPIDLHETSRPSRGDYFGDYVARANALMTASSEAVTAVQFERLSEMISDEKRKIFVIGGRISDTIAQYFLRHLRQIRPDVYHLSADPEVWPEYLLRMKSKDLLIIVDFRRYQASLASLAERAAVGNKPHVVLFTDKWLSPIAGKARDVIALPIESGTLWDSYVGAFVMIEAMLTRIAEMNWEKTRKRIQKWDSMRMETDDGK